ncbi:MAG: ABC-type transport auxiliary lipoprotein family protein [Thiobacillus sp.]|uniref:ABC-type transport auxiliary lipoprotein family protein n=1 Tax=Thiobacillus sp. TaxID=924 RepID=UPI00289588EE|nr:ABC-type transport auxiliary lipoprotein family protein [Thiobacillus sp.]MDT3706911.1 ABC-type transport auxiliary lipoprotein family protein [Thiobacillus sp.]
MKRTIAALGVGVALALGGCINIGGKDNGPAVVHYVLSDATPAASPAPVRADVTEDSGFPRSEARGDVSAPTLLVLDTTAGSFYDTDQIVFSRSAGTRGQYQFARWTERPGKRFAGLMRSRLDRQGAWRVSDTGGYARGDMLLDTELVEFYHDAVANPGQVRLVLRAELLDLKQRKLLGRREFEQRVAVASYDAKGAAEASNVAVGRVLDDLLAWLATFQ